MFFFELCSSRSPLSPVWLSLKEMCLDCSTRFSVFVGFVLIVTSSRHSVLARFAPVQLIFIVISQSTAASKSRSNIVRTLIIYCYMADFSPRIPETLVSFYVTFVCVDPFQEIQSKGAADWQQQQFSLMRLFFIRKSSSVKRKTQKIRDEERKENEG